MQRREAPARRGVFVKLLDVVCRIEGRGPLADDTLELPELVLGVHAAVAQGDALEKENCKVRGAAGAAGAAEGLARGVGLLQVGGAVRRPCTARGSAG